MSALDSVGPPHALEIRIVFLPVIVMESFVGRALEENWVKTKPTGVNGSQDSRGYGTGGGGHCLSAQVPTVAALQLRGIKPTSFFRKVRRPIFQVHRDGRCGQTQTRATDATTPTNSRALQVWTSQGNRLSSCVVIWASRTSSIMRSTVQMQVR